jgi:hypothetical protein
LSTALAEISLKIGEITERALILTGQLEKTSLSLIMVREEEAITVLKIGCTIYRLVTFIIQDKGTQTIKITC